MLGQWWETLPMMGNSTDDKRQVAVNGKAGDLHGAAWISGIWASWCPIRKRRILAFKVLA